MGRRPEQIFFQKDIWMANGHRQRCSTLLINIEMQIKITMKDHLISVRMDIIIKTTNNKYWWGCVEKGILGYCWCKGKLAQQLWKTVQESFRKFKVELIAVFTWRQWNHCLEKRSVPPCLLPTWKQFKHPSKDSWIKKMWCV